MPTSQFLSNCCQIPPKFKQWFPYPKFNTFQEAILPELLNTDRNVAISAPTGCGKTVAFELAAIRFFTRQDQNLDNSDSPIFCPIPKPAIVYLCPYRALCGERFRDWSRKFDAVGLQIGLLKGRRAPGEDDDLGDDKFLPGVDSDDLDEEREREILFSSELIVTTQEKLDHLLRSYLQLYSTLKLILIDEAHELNSKKRGARLEAVITRLKMRNSEPPRFVAVSATVPNLPDFGPFFGSETTSILAFGDEYRSVPLERIVIGVTCRQNCNAFAFDEELNAHLPSIIKEHSDNRPALVFCMSRRSTCQSAKACAARLGLMTGDMELVQRANFLRDQDLKGLVPFGVAFHHAGLHDHDKAIVEDLYLHGKLKILFSTSTLATGINLPAFLVVIKSTEHCLGERGRPIAIPNLTFFQMIGRAGRPQFDTLGRAVVLTRSDQQAHYQQLTCFETVESHLLDYLPEQINTEIAYGTITTHENALIWLRNTFAFVRLQKSGADFEAILEQKLLQTLGDLEEIGLIRRIGDGTRLEPTRFGLTMAKHDIRVDTMRSIMAPLDNFVKKGSFLALLELVSKSRDILEDQDVVVREEELWALSKLNADSCLFPVDNVKSASDKVQTLIQGRLKRAKFEILSFYRDAQNYVETASRIGTCLVEVLLERFSHRLIDEAFPLNSSQLFDLLHCVKSFRAQLWFNEELVAMQLPGIGSKFARSLDVDANLVTFGQIANANPQVISTVCGRGRRFGDVVKMAARRMPLFDISVTFNNNNSCQITIQLLNFKQKLATKIRRQFLILLIKNSFSQIAAFQRVPSNHLAQCGRFEVAVPGAILNNNEGLGGCLTFHLINLNVVGCDPTIDRLPAPITTPTKSRPAQTTPSPNKIAKLLTI